MKQLLPFFACILSLGTITAQTVTVNKSGGAGVHTSIGAALASFNPDPNPATPNKIQITDSSVYDEIFTISTPVTIEATGSSATLAVKSNTVGQFENGGIVINLPASLTTGTVALRNLKIIPALDTNGLRLKTAIENTNNNVFLWLDNVMIAPNAGDNTPLYTAGGFSSRVYETYSNANATYDPNIVQFGSHGLVLGDTTTGFQEGAGVELLLSNTVITHFRNDLYEPAPKPACYAIWMKPHFPGITDGVFPNVFRLTRIEGDSVISYAQFGLVATGDVSMANPDGHINFRGHSNYMMWFNGPAQNFRNLSNVIVEGGVGGILDQGYGTVRMNVKDSIVYYLAYRGFRFDKPSNDPASTGDGIATFENSTLVGGRTRGDAIKMYECVAGTTTDIQFKDTIISGRDGRPTDGNNLIFVAGENLITVDGCAVTTEGRFALRPGNPFSLGASATAPVPGQYLAADPMFKNIDPVVTDPSLPGFRPPSEGFMDVQNPAFATASSTGGPLGGGANYVGLSSGVNDWSVY